MVMEGILCVPPDRGPIIGRAVWKVRTYLENLKPEELRVSGQILIG